MGKTHNSQTGIRIPILLLLGLLMTFGLLAGEVPPGSAEDLAQPPVPDASGSGTLPEAACPCDLTVQLAYPKSEVISGSTVQFRTFVTAINCPAPVAYAWDFNYDGAADATTPDAEWSWECPPRYYSCENYAICKVSSGATTKQVGATMNVYSNLTENVSTSVLVGDIPLTVTFSGTPYTPPQGQPDPCPARFQTLKYLKICPAIRPTGVRS